MEEEEIGDDWNSEQIEQIEQTEQTEQTEQNNDSVVFVSENPLESTEDVEKTC